MFFKRHTAQAEHSGGLDSQLFVGKVSGCCLRLLLFSITWSALATVATERQLIRDPHFQTGFYLLESKPGKRVVYGQVGGLVSGEPVWDLAQWSSRFPLQKTDAHVWPRTIVCSNAAKSVIAVTAGDGADLSLAANASVEYGAKARKSAAEPWVHLLVQQNLENPPALDDLAVCQFHVEARLKSCRLTRTEDYSPSRHAAQYFVYLTIGNRNPRAPGFGECFWFGIPLYDDRHAVVPAYQAQDFGETKLFIYTPSSDTFAPRSTHDGAWVTFERDLLPLMRQGLEEAWTRRFILGSKDLADYQPLGIFIGWELPGTFDVDLQIRNLSLKAVSKN